MASTSLGFVHRFRLVAQGVVEVNPDGECYARKHVGRMMKICKIGITGTWNIVNYLRHSENNLVVRSRSINCQYYELVDIYLPTISIYNIYLQCLSIISTTISIHDIYTISICNK